MKILKRLLLAIVGIIALLLIIALFIPKQYTVTVSETINRPQAEVFDYVKMIRNQENYSVWVMADTITPLEYIGEDGTLGFIVRWDSPNNDVGAGEQEIIHITDTRMDVDLRFKRPFEGKAKAATIVEAISENECKVIFEFYGESPYPMNLMSIIGKKFIRDAEIQTLKNLKTILEQ